jgi:hypothetical protein
VSGAARARATDAVIAATVAGVLAVVLAADHAGTGDVRAYAWTVVLGAPSATSCCTRASVTWR